MSTLEKKANETSGTKVDVKTILENVKKITEAGNSGDGDENPVLIDGDEFSIGEEAVAEKIEKIEAEEKKAKKAKAKPLTPEQKLERIQEQQKKLNERMQKARAEVQKAKDKANVGDWRVITEGVLAMYDAGIRDKLSECLKDRKLLDEDEKKQFSQAMTRQLAIYREMKEAEKKGSGD